METINIELKVEKTFDIDVELSDVIYGINDLPMKKRWNYVSQIINSIQLDLSDLTDEQKQIVKEYLTKKLSIFDNNVKAKIVE